MSQKSRVSKVFAAAFVVLTVLVIGALVTMVVFIHRDIGSLNATALPPGGPPTPAPPGLRLPRDLLPESYRLFIWPRFYTRIPAAEGNATAPNQTTVFTGNSTVSFRCLAPTRSVHLHSRDLVLSDPVLLDRDSGRAIGVDRIRDLDTGEDIMELRLSEELQEGRNYSLFLAFSGDMSPHPRGLYLSSYKEGGSGAGAGAGANADPNTQRFLAATQLEAIGARVVFPCFDEPALRAVFHLTLIHRVHTRAVGNAEEAGSFHLDDEWKFTEFLPTPRMSSYLLAFIVSELEHVQFSRRSGDLEFTIRMHAQPEAIRDGLLDYAGHLTGDITAFFHDRFGLGFGMTTIDQVALPVLGPAAMENWGLITYHEGYLLYDPNVSSAHQKQEIAITIAHELAHQWFGNLVSIRWWNELWLKEGFATYMSYVAVDHVDKSFSMCDVFVAENMAMAMETDALASSHPLILPESDVQTSSSIGNLYDSISYSKGALLLRMLKDYMREGDFHRGVRRYLKTFQWQSTDHRDLWSALQQEESSSYIQISDFMEPWTRQSGFPVVTINTTTGQISQKHFLYNSTDQSSLLWKIPVVYTSNRKELSGELVLSTAGPDIKGEFIAGPGVWILANVNYTGYYRVNYNLENWNLLFAQLETNRNVIPLLNRVQIISDAFNLARAQQVNLTLALNSTRFLRNETEFLPWDAAVSNMGYILEMFDRSEVFGPLQMYLQNQVERLYMFYKNHTDSGTVPREPAQQQNQLLAVSVACSNGLPDCVAMVTRKFSEWMNNPSNNSIQANLRDVVYCQAVAAGGAEQWEFVWNQFLSCSDPAERVRLRKALSCSRRVWLLSRLLQYTLDPEKIRLNDVSSIIEDVSSNAAGHALAWNFIRAHWDYIVTDYGPSVIAAVSRRFSSQFELEELRRFVSDHGEDLEGLGDEVLERTQVNIEWVEQNRDGALQWFRRETEPRPGPAPEASA
ncbi:aminopeptidase Ey-like [Salarias fasciatus]|uniref:Aminopeptidase n=1 Tax=Salarias fasciatus TaxID=181472 RepID=A0A672I2W8_SALFA|nr:aminopeptidase Ey-like [Salarias fasciatus]